MPAGNAHRILSTLFEAFTAPVGPGILQDPGNAGVIDPRMNFQICEMTTGAAETRTLRNPGRPGIRLHLRLHSDGGDCVVTAANGLNATGNTQATFNADGEALDLISVSHTTGFRWEIVTNTGSVGLA
jgi:hypothetical protein